MPKILAPFTLGADTNLYRSGVNALKTDDNFYAYSVHATAGGFTADISGAGGLQLNNTGVPKWYLQNRGDAGDALRITSGASKVGLSISQTTGAVGLGGLHAENVAVHVYNTISGTGAYGLYTASMTLAPDTSWNAAFIVGGGTVDTGVANTVPLAVGVRTNPIVKAGTGTIDMTVGVFADTSTAGTANYGVVTNTANSAALWLDMGTDGTSVAGGMVFGASRDTNLYRSAANTLRTDDSLVVGGSLTIGTSSTGWSVTDTYTVLKAFNPTSATFAEALRVIATLVDTLITYGLLEPPE